MGSYGQAWRARIEMMRPGNAAMASAGVAVGILLAPASPPDATVWVGALLAAFLVTSFGNLVNDITDVEVDRRAHPERPLPAGRMAVSDATGFAVLVLGLGVIEAYVAGTWVLAAFAVVNAALLLAYALWLKRVALMGNIVVAALVASTFAFGAVAAGTRPGAWGILWVVLALMLVANLGRELLKDLQDAPADTGRQTFPQVFGARATLVAVQVAGTAVFGGAMWLSDQAAHWPFGARAMVTFAGILFVPASVTAYRSVVWAQGYYKAAMVVALGALTWAGLG